jgi:hypothetical protein
VPVVAKSSGKTSDVRLRSKDWYEQEWWPLEVAVAWTATGDKKICRRIAAGVHERRTLPGARFPSLWMALMIPQGLSRVKEKTQGAAYRRSMRNTVGEDGRALHPLEQAIKVTEDILACKRSPGGRPVKLRPFAKGSHGAGAVSAWISARDWRSASIVDDRRAGLILQSPTETVAAAWRSIDVLASPFKAMGADLGRRALALSEAQRLGEGEKNQERIRRKHALHEADMGCDPSKRGGRKKGSRNLAH